MIELGERLRKLRQEKRLRQDQVAALVNVTRSTVCTWESDTRQPSYETLVRLANLYNVSTDFLLGRTDDRLLDLSGLTAAEAAMISELVTSMSDKNRKLEEMKR
jgi:transcriptional regulator with XRE-family HTH domain